MNLDDLNDWKYSRFYTGEGCWNMVCFTITHQVEMRIRQHILKEETDEPG